MDRKELIKETIASIGHLPDSEIEEVKKFAELLRLRIEDKILVKGIQTLSNESNAFDFLREDEDLYTADDLIEKY